MRGLMIKEGSLKGDTCTKKMRPTKKILVNFLGCSFLLKITENPYFITLSQPQKITKTLLVGLIFLVQVSPFKRRNTFFYH